MAGRATAQVSRAPVQQFECMYCVEDKKESPVVIDSSNVCVECVKDTVLPKFHAAVKHEFNYPVEWSADVVLNPKDFKAFFDQDEYSRFIETWFEKEHEYKTLPHANRLYCKNVKKSGETCDAFLGDREAFLFDIAQCHSCDVWVCKHCGLKDEDHECKGSAEEKAPEDLKGFKRCPGCKGLIELKDGCNLVKCQTGSCGTMFCYICLTVDPTNKHFSRGMPCPKFGEPTDARRLYADDVVEEQQDDEDDGPDDGFQVTQAAANIYRDQMLLTAQGPTNDLPVPISEALPAIAEIPMAAVTMLEQRDAVNQILADREQVREEQLGIVARDRQLMQAVLNSWQEVQDDMREAGLLDTQPTLGVDLRDAAANLHANLELYIDGDALRRAYEDFDRRHERIMAFIHQHMTGQFFLFSPWHYHAFALYRELAPTRLAAASLQIVGERAVALLQAMERGTFFDVDEVMVDADAPQVQRRIGHGLRQIAQDDLGEMDNEPTSERDRDAWVMRVRARIAVLRRTPPGHPNRLANPANIAHQREIMEDARDMAGGIVFMGTDGFREVLADIAELDENAEHQAELATRFVAASTRLSTNLDMYRHWTRVRNNHAQYSERHNQIMAFIENDLPPALFHMEPEVYAMFMLYKTIGPERLAAAAPQRMVGRLLE